jgi:4-amino-4-deoxy-L-arabinose transferase-like glycosyltransferase
MPKIFHTRPRLCLGLCCLLLWLPGFFSLPPSDRDESRFALATRQMTETGDYVRIMNGDVARNRKPIGIHWLQAPFVLAARAAGLARTNPIWPYRLPSLLGALLAVFATFRIARLAGAGEGRAQLAGLMLAGCVILTVEAHIAKTDAALLGATTVAQAMLAQAWLAPDTLRRRHAALFWLAVGAGILIKGPITPLVTGLTALTLSAAWRRTAWLRTLRPAWGIPLMLGVTLPWLTAIGLATHGAFFAEAVGGDLGRKLAGGEETHGAPPGFHLLLLPLLAFPASTWVLRAAPRACTARRDPATSFVLAWLIPAWLMFEAVPTKLPHYTLPLYPALFLLAALHGMAPARGRAALLPVLTVAALLGAAALGLPMFLHMPWWLGAPALPAMALVAFLCWRDRPIAALLAMAPVYGALLWLELPNLRPLWIAPRLHTLLAAWPGYLPSGDNLVAGGYAEPSLLFLAGPHVALMPNGSSAAQALAHGRAAAIVTGADEAAFLAEARRLSLNPQLRGSVAGFDYSRGKPVTLTFFVLPAAR